MTYARGITPEKKPREISVNQRESGAEKSRSQKGGGAEDAREVANHRIGIERGGNSRAEALGGRDLRSGKKKRESTKKNYSLKKGGL